MGSRTFTRNGESTDEKSGSVVRPPAGGIRNRISAGSGLLLLCISALGLAADVFHWRIARAPGLVRTLPRRGIGGLAADASQGLEQPGTGYRLSLETVSVPHAAYGGHELRVAWNTGHVSDVPAARLGILAAETRRTNCLLDDRRDNRRNQLRLPVRQNRQTSRDRAGLGFGNFHHSAVGIFAGIDGIGHRCVRYAVHGAGRLGSNPRTHHRALAGQRARLP